MPFQNATRVSIDHKHGMIAGIQQNRVGGLRSNAMERKQFVAEVGGRLREHPRQ